MDYSPFTSEKFSRKDFEFLGSISALPFGRIEKARNTKDNKEYSLKIFEKSHLHDAETYEKSIKEKEIHQRLKSPGVLPLHCTFTDSDNVYFVFEHCPHGNLIQLMQRFAKFPFELARFFAGELVFILEVLRSEGIVHSEINFSNLMVSSDFHLFIAGFGDAVKFGERGKKKVFTENFEYLSPEALEGESSASVDVWAAGCLIYQMLVGKTPFAASTNNAIIDRIKNGQIDFPGILPPFAVDLIQSMLLSDPNIRLGANSILDLKTHIFFQGLEIDTIYKLPVPDYKHEMTKGITAKSRIIFEGVVKKKAGWIYKKRLLIISEEPKISYYEPTRREFRGEIAISPQLRGEVKNKIDFHIITPKRTYYFKVINETPDKWVKAVAELVRKVYG